MTHTIHSADHEAITTDGVNPEADALRADNQRLRAELTEANERHQQLLIDMGIRAKETGAEHDWCGVAQNLVEELGGIWPEDETYTYRLTVSRTWTLEGTSTDGSHDTETLADCLYEKSFGAPGLDGSEWSNLSTIVDTGFEVTGYQTTG